ncbi:MAG TPA: hypothetical protein VEX60_10135 [Pyrinomonadaceae bacterium]|nr:hypothetical protein [Pyrinomonadaceae bacterium]
MSRKVSLEFERRLNQAKDRYYIQTAHPEFYSMLVKRYSEVPFTARDDEIGVILVHFNAVLAILDLIMYAELMAFGDAMTLFRFPRAAKSSPKEIKEFIARVQSGFKKPARRKLGQIPDGVRMVDLEEREEIYNHALHFMIQTLLEEFPASLLNGGVSDLIEDIKVKAQSKFGDIPQLTDVMRSAALDRAVRDKKKRMSAPKQGPVPVDDSQIFWAEVVKVARDWNGEPPNKIEDFAIALPSLKHYRDPRATLYKRLTKCRQAGICGNFGRWPGMFSRLRS